MNSFIIILGLAIWGIVHSFLASHLARDLFPLQIGGFDFYRLAYNLFAVITFIPILYLAESLPDQTLYRVPAQWNLVFRSTQVLAVILLFVTFFQTDWLAFIGLRQAFGMDSRDGLVTSGMYRLTRHPLYTFSLLMVWMSPEMTNNSLTLYLGATLYTIIGAFFEERKLLKTFGAAYAEYRSATPMMIPWLPRKR